MSTNVALVIGTLGVGSDGTPSGDRSHQGLETFVRVQTSSSYERCPRPTAPERYARARRVHSSQHSATTPHTAHDSARANRALSGAGGSRPFRLARCVLA